MGEPAENIEQRSLDFIRTTVEQDLASNKFAGRVHTRFPPEPNAYLHIGHAKAICTNFGVAADYDGLCNLRFDDTNPSREEIEYVEAMKRDIQWLGFDWDDRLYHASDYFGYLYACAEELIKKGKAYVDDLSPAEIRAYRGTLTEPGRNSPYRDRSVEENLDLFRRMRAGEFPEESRVLRAKIDMASPNIVMRDPVLYRILYETHHRTGDEWCIYPLYDFTHCLSDSIEGITHSLCSLEFENNRALYDWILQELGTYRSYQYEFARLNLTYTLTSKRRLLALMDKGVVSGWDDPRLPTLVGMRRRGYTPEAIRAFMDAIGLSKANSVVDVALLEHFIRQDLNARAPRRMGVLDPLKLVIDNYPEDKVEELEAINNPEDETMGTRRVPFSRVLYIEQDDFREDPPRRFYRLSPGQEVRLRYAYLITCTDVIKDEHGQVIEVHATYDPATRGGDAPDGRRVRGTLHWVSAAHALPVTVRLYDRLFKVPDPAAYDDMTEALNPESLEVRTNCYAEPSLEGMEPGYTFQFERQGYFCVDSDSAPDQLVLNRTIALRDSWARIERQQQNR